MIVADYLMELAQKLEDGEIVSSRFSISETPSEARHGTDVEIRFTVEDVATTEDE